MAFKTSQQLFGNGAGSPGSAGWVPVDTSAPATYTADNRGIAFGEQLTSAIANRSHYALALNTDDLNTRLVVFETDGLDAAYRLGAAATAGGGRVITKDGGAVETVSTLATQLADDKANAHFRADATGDAIDGGGGFDFAANSQTALASALYGFLDRRYTDFSGVTSLTGSVAVTLNSGGTATDGATIGAGAWADGSSNTHIAIGRDMVEILSGAYRGLYVITALPTTTRATLRNLDGTAPSFAANTVTTLRVYRPTFGTFSAFGHSGLNYGGISVMGMPSQTSALELVPGATYGRYGTNTDGAKYAMRVMSRTAAGVTTSPVFEVDGLGRARSYASNDLLLSADMGAGVEFGAAAFYVEQPKASSSYETGFAAKSIGDLSSYYGVLVAHDQRPPSSSSGTINFDFISVASYNIDLGDVTAADFHVTPTVTMLEILTPAAQAGTYLITARDTNNGHLTIENLGSDAVSGLPTSGSGTCRLLYGVTLGRRRLDFEDGFLSSPSATTAAMVVEAPAENDSSGLVIVTSQTNNHYPLRVVSADDGLSSEVFQVDQAGNIGARSAKVSSSGGYTYTTTPSRKILISLEEGRCWANTTDWTLGGTSPFVAAHRYWASATDMKYVVFPLNAYLREGMIVTDVKMLVDPGAARTGAGVALSLTLGYTVPDLTTPATPAAATSVASQDQANTAVLQVVSLAASLGAGHTVVREGATARDYFLAIYAGSDGGAHVQDRVYAIELTVSDPGPRNH